MFGRPSALSAATTYASAKQAHMPSPHTKCKNKTNSDSECPFLTHQPKVKPKLDSRIRDYGSLITKTQSAEKNRLPKSPKSE